MKTKISIIIPCLNEEKYISSCLDSILSSDFTNLDKEIILIDGESEDKTQSIIKQYQYEDRCIKLLINPLKYTPVSMNRGIKEANGDYIFIISAHAFYPKSYFIKLIQNIKALQVDCVGAVLITKVKNITKKSYSIKNILEHKFGVGNASFRIGTQEIKEVDTVAFGCYSKEVFTKYGDYDERLIRNQDIELNKRISNNGGKIYLIPNVHCIYYARENFIDLAKNNYGNGYWNILTTYYTKTFNSLSLRHFIPLLFVYSLFFPILFSLFMPKLLFVALLSLSSYLALVIIISLKLKEKNNSFVYLIGSFLTLHLSYGVGSFVGIFSIIKKYLKGDR